MVDYFTDVRGPAVCPRPCVECADRRHHWLSESRHEDGCDCYDCAAGSHEAVLQGYDDWLACKHCHAWHPITDQMLDDPDFEFV